MEVGLGVSKFLTSKVRNIRSAEDEHTTLMSACSTARLYLAAPPAELEGITGACIRASHHTHAHTQVSRNQATQGGEAQRYISSGVFQDCMNLELGQL